MAEDGVLIVYIVFRSNHLATLPLSGLLWRCSCIFAYEDSNPTRTSRRRNAGFATFVAQYMYLATLAEDGSCRWRFATPGVFIYWCVMNSKLRRASLQWFC